MQVDLSDNYLGPEGAKALASGIRDNGSVTSADVGYNSIGKEAALNLISIFKQKQMVSVGLAKCDLGPEGAGAVAELIRDSPSLTAVNVLRNSLDVESANMLAEVAKTKGISLCGIETDATTADLSDQRLGPTDAILVASDLTVRSSMTEVLAF